MYIFICFVPTYTDIGTLISLAKLIFGLSGLSRKISGVAKTEGGVTKYGLRFNNVYIFDSAYRKNE